MHEASIVNSLIEQVKAFTPPRAVVLSVRVEVGVLEHLDEDVIRNLWSMFAEDAALRGAALEVTRIPLRVRCGECGTVHDPPDPVLLFCPTCGVARPEVLNGSGVVLKSIEVDVPEGEA